MSTSAKLRAFASALLLACSVSILGMLMPEAGHDSRVNADSAWGVVVPSPAQGQPASASQIERDSAWG
ncbi:hypothetical protein [Streptomyces sp. NPDC093707]|uniref:hypothetical protein n=1 Tax=Streptomyces sp. NPDC093707 TaxID=3154984 RepID=UPI00344CD132